MAQTTEAAVFTIAVELQKPGGPTWKSKRRIFMGHARRALNHLLHTFTP